MKRNESYMAFVQNRLTVLNKANRIRTDEPPFLMDYEGVKVPCLTAWR